MESECLTQSFSNVHFELIADLSESFPVFENVPAKVRSAAMRRSVASASRMPAKLRELWDGAIVVPSGTTSSVAHYVKFANFILEIYVAVTYCIVFNLSVVRRETAIHLEDLMREFAEVCIDVNLTLAARDSGKKIRGNRALYVGSASLEKGRYWEIAHVDDNKPKYRDDMLVCYEITSSLLNPVGERQLWVTENDDSAVGGDNGYRGTDSGSEASYED